MSVSEQELVEAAVAPRVTMEALEANIVSEHYFTAYQGAAASKLLENLREDPQRVALFYAQDLSGKGGSSEVGTDGSVATGLVPEELRLLTFCVLVLKNGFTVHGVSACAAKENYDQSIGERIARSDAVNKIWPLMGYELRTQLYLQQQVNHLSTELHS